MIKKENHKINNFLKANGYSQLKFAHLLGLTTQGAVRNWRVDGVSLERAAQIEAVTYYKSVEYAGDDALFKDYIKAVELRQDDPPTIVNAYVEEALKLYKPD